MAGIIALQFYQRFIVLQLGGLMAGGWPEAGGINHCILRKHPNKESRVSVGVKTTSLRNADLKMMQIERAHCQGAQREGSNLAYRAELEETISSVCGNWGTNSKQSRRRIQAVPNQSRKA